MKTYLELERVTCDAARMALSTSGIFAFNGLSLAKDAYDHVEKEMKENGIGELVWTLPDQNYFHVMVKCPSVPGCAADEWVCLPYTTTWIKTTARLCPLCTGVVLADKEQSARKGTKLLSELRPAAYPYAKNTIWLYFDKTNMVVHLGNPCNATRTDSLPKMKIEDLERENVSRVDVCRNCRELALNYPKWYKFFERVGAVPGVFFVV